MSACLSQSKRPPPPLQMTHFDLLIEVVLPSSKKKSEGKGRKKAKRDDDTREAGIIRGDTLTEIVQDVPDRGTS